MSTDTVYQECLSRYWRVSRCWNDYSTAVQEGMSVERAIWELADVAAKCPRTIAGGRLADRVLGLLQEIILKQDGPEVESEEGVRTSKAT